MNHGTTPRSDKRPGVGQAPELCCEGRRYAPGHTITGVGKINQVGLIGGTFDRFHAGHQNLLMSALSHCHRVEVWVTVDSIARAKDSRINTWEQRVEEGGGASPPFADLSRGVALRCSRWSVPGCSNTKAFFSYKGGVLIPMFSFHTMGLIIPMFSFRTKRVF